MAGSARHKNGRIQVAWECESTPDAKDRLLAAYEMLMVDASWGAHGEAPFDTNSKSAIMRHDKTE